MLSTAGRSLVSLAAKGRDITWAVLVKTTGLLTVVGSGSVAGENFGASITVHPQPETVTEPTGVTFTVTATGTAPLSYQWQRNGVDIPGATATSYTLSPTSATDSGALFRCVVSNAFGPPATSNEATLTVQAEGAFTPPYALPSTGQVVALNASASFNATVPTERTWTIGEWQYSHFSAFGVGVFVPGFSAAGAYVSASMGGDNHPESYDGLVFDFTTGTWSRRLNGNGVLLQNSGSKATPLGSTNGSPWFEVTAPSVSVVPCAPHPYAHHVWLPNVGSTSKGSMLIPFRTAIITVSASAKAHLLDLDTFTYSRYVPTNDPSRVGVEGDCLYDATLNRVWHIDISNHARNSLQYLDLNDNTWKTSAGYSFPNNAHGVGYNRCFWHNRLIMRQLGSSDELHWFDTENPSLGWNAATLSASLTVDSMNRFVRFGSTNNYYWINNAGGNTLTRLTAPADPKNGTWQVSTVSITDGPTIPRKWRTSVSDGTQHYEMLFYVPSINCLAWVASGDGVVYLIKPE